MASDSAGNVVILIREWEFPPPLLRIIKLAPDGTELWRAGETNVIAGAPRSTFSAIRLDAADNILVLGLRSIPANTNDGRLELFVSKYSPQGARLWTVPLPGLNYSGLQSDLTKCLAVLPDGGFVVTGYQGLPADASFVAKFDADGRLVWFRNTDGNCRLPADYSSVVANHRGEICSSGSVSAVFSAEGQILVNHDDEMLGGLVFQAGPDGEFRLNQYDGRSILGLSPDGAIRWRTALTCWTSVGAVEDGEGGSIAVGGATDSYRGGCSFTAVSITRLDKNGNAIWTHSLPLDACIYRVFRNLNSLLRVSDGSYRIVVNQPSTPSDPRTIGVNVVAFSLTNPPPSPVITRPPDPCNWDGQSNIVLQVEAVGSEPLRYQWFNMTEPLPGATNATLVIASNDVPFSRGFFSVEVNDGIRSAVSRGVELRAGGIILKAWPPDDTGIKTVSVYADIGVRYQIESSTNLTEWAPVPGATGSFVISTQVPIPDDGAAFFRAVALP